MELKIDISDLDNFNVDNLDLTLGADDNTGMLIIEGHTGYAIIDKEEIQQIRKDFEEDNDCFVTSILLVGYRDVVISKYEGVDIDVLVWLDETKLNRGINGEFINVDIEGVE